MVESHRRRRQVDLFNFSFLDILACVIGLLIFILTIVVISGGAPKRSAEGRLTAAEHDFRDARSAERLTAETRQHLQELLRHQADAAIDPEGAARALQANIRLLKDQAASLHVLKVRAHERVASLQRELESMPANSSDPVVSGIGAEARGIDAETNRLIAEAARVRQQKAKTQQVSYYIPRLRETARRQLWLEMAGARVWALESDAYEKIPIDLTSTEYRRVGGNAGCSLTDVIGSRPAGVAMFEDYPADTTVIIVALRPDGYSSFRRFRDWAWKQGYSVNWSPLDQHQPIVLTRTGRNFEQ